jgi:hypothetical protein
MQAIAAREEMSTAGKAALWIGGGLLALGAAIGVGVYVSKKGASSSPATGAPTTPTVAVTSGALGTVTLPSYAANGTGESLTLTAPSGQSFANIVSSNPAVVTTGGATGGANAVLQISGPGTATLTIMISSGVTATLNVVVQP